MKQLTHSNKYRKNYVCWLLLKHTKLKLQDCHTQKRDVMQTFPARCLPALQLRVMKTNVGGGKPEGTSVLLDPGRGRVSLVLNRCSTHILKLHGRVLWITADTQCSHRAHAGVIDIHPNRIWHHFVAAGVVVGHNAEWGQHLFGNDYHSYECLSVDPGTAVLHRLTFACHL